ncbi:hypothetical protein [Ferruginibacter sp. HRS2-29]|uniref:immunity protein Imm33 domain-containing protein n=1 Tax=Ferruginibacter sp. HRS2-29 TaxID=2487334 RepID=UPI0020CCF4B3|nr:hypothetical protein [Ferruginibacter sp. HRS2-29]MCP9752445.1 hypothetical protein [Ferruginibacter sp. HRS2-29]
MDNIENDFLIRQKSICEKYNADFLMSPFNKLIGVALKSFESFTMPINGLRHPIENMQSANWYIWAGEYSEDIDFFQPVHIEHLLQICPKAINYLGLAPGWRFLFDNNYEDVWFDANLLNI